MILIHIEGCLASSPSQKPILQDAKHFTNDGCKTSCLRVVHNITFSIQRKAMMHRDKCLFIKFALTSIVFHELGHMFSLSLKILLLLTGSSATSFIRVYLKETGEMTARSYVLYQYLRSALQDYPEPTNSNYFPAKGPYSQSSLGLIFS